MMQRTFVLLSLSAALSLLSGCAMNDLFPGDSERSAPPPPQAEALPAQPARTTAAAAPAAVLSEDKPQSISRAPEGTLTLPQSDIRGNAAAQPALEDSGDEILLARVSTPGAEINENAVPGTVTALPETPARPQGVGGSLPTYATGSGAGSSCPLALGQAAAAAAAQQGAALASKLEVEPGTVYAAPTIIPDEYLDCVSDLSGAISQAVSASNSALSVISAASRASIEQNISQNSGSAATLPLIIRTLRAENVPYLIVSTLRRLDDDCALTVRFVRVSDGITLSQSVAKLKLPAADSSAQ